MDQAVVVGVGNIYASESLHLAGINPRRSARQVSQKRLVVLITAIRQVLEAAIKAGGSTISDFRQAGGSSGYFQHQFRVYERAGEPCHSCATPIKHTVLGQRASYWCPQCQR
jgi:formamidopyrimidine-DNA glycosylase